MNAFSTSPETFSNSLRTNSALAPAASRSSTRAPISIASADRADRVLARFLALAHEADGAVVGHDEAVDDQPVADYCGHVPGGVELRLP